MRSLSRSRRLAGLALGLLMAVPLGTAPASGATPGPGTSVSDDDAAPAIAAIPSKTAWVAKMNQIVDKSGTFFIADYGDPGYFDWSSDGCTNPAPDARPFGFLWACRRHDFGYRNLQGAYPSLRNRNNKAVIDRQFLADMYTHCHVEWNDSGSCRAAARGYHAVVSRYKINTVGVNRSTLVVS